MKKRAVPFVVVILILLIASSGTVRANSRAFDSHRLAGVGLQQNEFLIRIDNRTSRHEAEAYLASKGLAVLQHLPEIGVWRVAAPSSQFAPSLMATLQEDRTVVNWVEPNGEVQASAWVPTDPFYGVKQSHLAGLGFPDAWSFSQGTGVTIAILDSGVSLNHPDLSEQIWTNPLETPGNAIDDDGNGLVDDVHGWDYVNADASPQDDYGHGSHVAGIAAAIPNNGVGIAGAAGQAKILPVKVLNSAGTGYWSSIAAGIIYAADQNAKVINLSLGGPISSATVEAAVAYAVEQGCLVIAAAGNKAAAVEYPAALPDVLAIAATDSSYVPWASSNRGDPVDLAAPGVNIFSANQADWYYVSSGTSMSTPHVSGLAALVWSLRPDFTALQVRQTLLDTAKDVYTTGWDQRTGWGVIDAKKAVLAAVQPQLMVLSSQERIQVSEEKAEITVTVYDWQGRPVSDGVLVDLETTLGSLSPASAVTVDGQVSTQLTSSRWGRATIIARVENIAQATTFIEVIPNQIFYPFIAH